MCNEKINDLTNIIENLKEDLKLEYMQVFNNDTDTQEAIKDLNDFGKLRYTRHGLVQSLKVDMRDFDELAIEALEDYMEERGIHVDSVLGYLNKPVSAYLICLEDDFTTKFVLSMDGKEEMLDMFNKTLSEKEKETIVNQIKDSRLFSGVVVNCDEVGSIRVMNL